MQASICGRAVPESGTNVKTPRRAIARLRPAPTSRLLPIWSVMLPNPGKELGGASTPDTRTAGNDNDRNFL
jgi:hypothetical protein